MIRMLQLHWKKIIIIIVFSLLMSWLSVAEERLDGKFQEAVRNEKQKQRSEKSTERENKNRVVDSDRHIEIERPIVKSEPERVESTAPPAVRESSVDFRIAKNRIKKLGKVDSIEKMDTDKIRHRNNKHDDELESNQVVGLAEKSGGVFHLPQITAGNIVFLHVAKSAGTALYDFLTSCITMKANDHKPQSVEKGYLLTNKAISSKLRLKSVFINFQDRFHFTCI